MFFLSTRLLLVVVVLLLAGSSNYSRLIHAAAATPGEEQESNRKHDDNHNNNNKRQNRVDGGAAAGEVPVKPNLLWIVTDQQRWDTIRIVQDTLKEYEGKLKISTPNIDRLARRGVLFETAYCMSPSCAPARAVLRTGNMLQRTGINRNKLVSEATIAKMDFIQEKVDALQTFEQVLVDELGYQAETYGKWHAPFKFFHSRKDNKTRILKRNAYDFRKNKPYFHQTQIVKPWYLRSLNQLRQRDKISCDEYKEGQQMNPWSRCPYTPISMDPRYDMETNTSLSTDSGLEIWEVGGENHCGQDSLGANYTATGVIGQSGLKALSRLIARGVPWSLAIHFNGPHPPLTAPSNFAAPYLEQKDNIFVSPSIHDPMDNSAYVDINGRHRIGDERYGWNNEEKVKEATAIYYGQIEEIDAWIGRYLDRLDEYHVQKSTLIIFTSDHGEMLGAHGMRNKFNFLEESARVPLIISFPGLIPRNKVVKQHVSHLDIFSTVLDYLKASKYDNSDGTSLRSRIAGRSFNRQFDEHTIVCELDERVPANANEFDAELGAMPNFMIRKGNFKLILPKLRDSPVIDMMYNLKSDPQEMKNLLGSNAVDASEALIGKAEHLKALLWEKLNRADGEKGYYSDPKYNLNVGEGDLSEIFRRRTWPEVDYWQSEQEELPFGRPVLVRKRYIRNEYIYIGRTTKGVLNVRSVQIVGPDSQYFRVNYPRKVVDRWWWSRIKVHFTAFENHRISDLEAYVQINTDLGGIRKVKIVPERL